MPILLADSVPEAVGRSGPLLGFFDDVKFENVQVALKIDDVLVAYTDGVTEARRGHNLLGDRRLEALLVKVGRESPRAVLDQLVQSALLYGGSPNRDDIAAIAFRAVDGPPRRSDLVHTNTYVDPE